ncbi:MAG: hypothetical protein HOJ15_03580 [Candidatus Jacksonbacteria bacterium]|jgi:hypothetical protein|nr:hypothetical protein [Candidatus Jacksonbacteria bacterium]MBT6034471.1 hypothetical protein [Candidatus Jacksonbacteria bacterium]MBT6301480.1 hypothetical protein [Candidatus Jacksonbacteria bacterium]MBT6756892.1 hypothetical protein [Candidatus Jacksonbacteria bacterium]MBT6954884.1 hypothetical protein [Candidatus Jacksonbacteria bacterium]
MRLRKEQLSPQEVKRSATPDKEVQTKPEVEFASVSFDNVEGMSKEDSQEYNAEVLDCIASVERVLALPEDDKTPAEERASIIRSDIATLEEIKGVIAGEGREDVVAQIDQLLAQIKENKSVQSLLESPELSVVGGGKEPHEKFLETLKDAKSGGAYNSLARGLVERIRNMKSLEDREAARRVLEALVVAGCVVIIFGDGVVSDALYDTGVMEQSEDNSNEASEDTTGATAGEAQGLTDKDKEARWKKPLGEDTKVVKKRWWQKK